MLVVALIEKQEIGRLGPVHVVSFVDAVFLHQTDRIGIRTAAAIGATPAMTQAFSYRLGNQIGRQVVVQTHAVPPALAVFSQGFSDGKTYQPGTIALRPAW